MTADAALHEAGLDCLRAGDLAQAAALFGQAGVAGPDDHAPLLSLGVALQGERRHEAALVALERAQQARQDDPRPFLHASLSHLALGHAEAALAAADAACARAPLLAAAHSARGQALLALNDPARAEQAFAAALRYAPRSADMWVLCGVARFRQGAIDGAAAAMREALGHAPDHAVAKDNLDALLRLGAGTQTKASAPPAPADGQAAPDDLRLTIWQPADRAASLGLAVEFLSRMPAFAKLQFGEWSQVLFYQAERGHCLFVIDQHRRVRGFLGWALTEQTLAEQWVEGRAGLRNDQCRDGDCVIINAVAAETAATKRFIVETMRDLFASRRMVYFKRHYPDGRARPSRLSVNKFVEAHLKRASERR
jgi:tetratricopeptide (TPR) repeat protein